MIVIGCDIDYSSSNYVTPVQSSEAAKAEITKNLLKQQSDWNKGDIDSFMLSYWASDSLNFVGKRGVTKGWKQTLENYKKGYPDKDAMGELIFDILELKNLGPESYLMLGKFTLIRKEDSPSGFFSLIWERKKGKWVITTDHTSG